MGVQVPQEEQPVTTEVPKDKDPEQVQKLVTEAAATEEENGENGAAHEENGNSNEKDVQVIEEEEVEEDEEEDDDDEEEEDYKGEDDDDDDDDDDEEEEEGEEANGDSKDLAAKMGLTKEVVSQFVSKSNLVVRALHEAAKDDDVEAITKILEAEGEEQVDVNATDPYEYTALHHAAENNKVAALKKLIQANAKLELTTRFYACRPIHYAAFKGHNDVLQALLDAGADINAQSEDGRTPLFHACLHNRLDCVRTLVQAKADASIKDKQDKTPADVATSREILDILEAPAVKKARTE